MKPYYEDTKAGIVIYHGDCREVLPGLAFDVVVTDPPYGIDYDGGTKQRWGQHLGRVVGDDGSFDPAPLLSAKDAILWGCNHYHHRIPMRGQWYVWDKVLKNGLDVRIAECEFAWHMLGTKPRIFRHLWSGAYRASEAGQKSVHPTQKPVRLMAWCLELVADGQVIDPYMGSGPVLRAAKDLGRRAIGIEIEERYCEIAARRLAQEVLF